MQIEVNGIRVNYELTGREGAPVVALSHSLGSSLEMWNPQMEILAQYFRVLRYDTRGHGGSAAPEGPYTLDALTQDAVGLLDALEIEKLHWVGLSMGGMIGQSLALEHGNRIVRLALCDTAAIIPEDAQPVWQERIDTVREKGLRALVDSTLERWFTPPYLARNSQEVRLIRRLFLETPAAGFIGCSEAIRHLNYLERLGEISLPTLIMVGEDDPGTPVAASEAMHERIPNSELVILPSAAHLSNIEQAEAFNKALIGFLRQEG